MKEKQLSNIIFYKEQNLYTSWNPILCFVFCFIHVCTIILITNAPRKPCCNIHARFYLLKKIKQGWHKKVNMFLKYDVQPHNLKLDIIKTSYSFYTNSVSH